MEGTKQFTLRDALNECALLRHSKEYFNLLKESSELGMLETYIENQQFIAEQADDDVFKALNESGYFESTVAEDQLKQYIEATELKKKNIFVTIWEGIKKFFKIIGSFFANLFKKIKGLFTKDDDADFIDDIDDEDYDDEYYEESANKPVTEATDKKSGIVAELVKIYNDSIFGKSGVEFVGTEKNKTKITGAIFKKVDAKKLVKAVHDCIAEKNIYVRYDKSKEYRHKANTIYTVLETLNAVVDMADEVKKENEGVLKGNRGSLPKTHAKIAYVKKLISEENRVCGFSFDDYDIKYCEDRIKEAKDKYDQVKADGVAIEGKADVQKDVVKIYADLAEMVNSTIGLYNGVCSFVIAIGGWAKKWRAAKAAA